MTEYGITRVLSQGLTVRLIAAPDLSAASACLSTRAGSFHEPERWPGLAHLLEHLLFQSGQGFQGDERLMPWISARQGRVNATTGLSQTLFYFDCRVEDLPGGLARLLDMVNAPVFTAETAERESRVIEAEYQLLSQQARTLMGAFFHSRVSSPTVYHRFVVGNHRTLSGDLPALLQALGDFFRQHYRADKLTLTIRAPLTLPELQQLVQSLPELTFPSQPSLPGDVAAADFPVVSRAVHPAQLLQLPGDVHHCLEMVVADPGGELLAAVPLLQALFEDAAPGSLRHYWVEEGLCREMTLEVISTATGTLWLMVHLIRPASTPLPAGRLTAAWQLWLRQLTELSSERVAHYQQLAQRQFCLLSPMEQIRRIVSGHAVSDKPVLPLALALLAQSPNELQTCDRLNSALHSACGFPCVTETQTLSGDCGVLPDNGFVFYPQMLAPPETATGHSAAIPQGWRHLRTTGSQAEIVMRPVQGTVLSAAQAARLEQILQPVFSLARHCGGEAAITSVHGVNWLTVSVAQATDAETVCLWLAKLWPTDLAVKSSDPQQILIRRLLAEFPSMLASTAECPDWSGAIRCSDLALFSRLSEILQQRLPVPAPTLIPSDTAGPVRSLHQPESHGDNGLLFFMPLPGETEGDIVAAKALAALYQPAFYHWLREELSVGYVVSCHYQLFINTPGILCVLQSPGYDCQQLSLWCQQFFSRMTPQVEQLAEAPQVNAPQPLHHHRSILRAMEQLDPLIRAAACPEQQQTPSVVRLQQLHNYWAAHTEEAIQLSCGRPVQ
ncbi:pyrroloquinoline quinone biosynthesis protein PqqF [Tatumella sp. UBA2305]|uniref:pyrroloquinoline quinone biosynthesis protein PqqF n=1 Tax=Tatumella sp. UBA2305 TaxID=1947647 RepID=UPI0025E8FC2A|nr:pyrroloquinoline quinone biosynthesis protein PqqF [Tatumella sp. UBA2305]